MRLRLILGILLCAAVLPAAAQAPCATLSLPFSEDFDNHGPTATLPPCWVASRNYDLGPAPAIDSTQHHSGQRSLMLYSGTIASSHYSIAISPELDTTSLDGLYLRLRMYAASTSTRLEVGICQDTGRYTRQFTPLDTLQAARPGQWQEHVVDLGRYRGSGRRLAFRLQRSLQGTASYCYLDDLRIGPCGTTLPTVSHLGARQLTLDWQPYGNDAITLAYNGLTIPNATPPLTITGLTPSTTYTFSVGCDGSAPQQVSATTLPGPSLVPAWYDSATTTLAAHDSALLILPLQESTPTQNLNVALLLRADSGARLAVGAMTFPGEAASFIAVDTLQATAAWQRHTVSLASYPGGGGYIALRALGTGTVWVDELRVARCLIDSLRFYGLTESGLTIDWQHLTGPCDVLLEYGPPGFTPGTGLRLTATAPPYTLASLAPATQYDLLAYPACGDQPCDYDRHSFTTFAHTVVAPYCQGFEEGVLPLGWVCPAGSTATSTTAYQGSRSLQLDAGSTVSLPMVNTTGSGALWLEFSGQGADTLTVGTMATPYSTFTPLATYTGTGWTRRALPLNLPAGHLVAFRAGGIWRLDAVALHHDAIASATASSVTQTTAHLEWQMLHGDSVLMEYKAVSSATADFSVGTGTTLRVAGETTLTGLQSGTHYVVHLIPLSDVGSADCHHLTLRFLTAPTPVNAPYCESFDALSNNGYPATWRRLSTLGNYPLATNGRSHSSPRSLYFRANANGKTVALLPDIVSPSTHLTLAFWTNTSHCPAGTRLIVGHMSNAADYGSFTPIDTLALGALDTWRHHVVELGTRHSNVAIMLVGGTGESRVYLDDLCIEPCSVSDISLHDINSNDVALTWQNHGAYGIEVSTTGIGLSRVDTFYSSPTTISGLDTNTEYTFVFRSLCDCGDYGGSYRSSYGSTGDTATDNRQTLAIRTVPHAVPTPYCYTFDQIPAGYFPWPWGRHGSLATVSDLLYLSPSRSVRLRENASIVLPPIDNLGQMVVSVNAYATNEAAMADGALLLGTMRHRDSIASFVVHDTLRLTRPREWQRLYTTLRPTSHRYLAIRFLSADTCTLFLDDVNVSPCGIGEASITSDGHATWQNLLATNAVAIEYGLQGFPLGSGTTDTVHGTSYSITGMSPGDNYDLYLFALCDTAANCLPVKLSTSNPTATPYCEHFETTPVGGLPDKWLVGRTYNSTPTVTTAGSNHALMLRSHTASDSRSLAILPELAGGNDSLQVRISMRSSNATSARLVIGYVDADADPNTFVAFDTLANNISGAWQCHTILLPPPIERRIALGAMALSQTAEILLDSLSVTRGFTPTAVPISARTLALDWPSASNYVEYGPAGFVQGTGTLLHATARHHVLSGLQPNQTYWFYTRDDNTTPSCMPPLAATMPSEVSLPFCQSSPPSGALQLPEIDIDSLYRLHLFITLQGSVAVGVMEYNDDWEHLLVLDTLTTPVGTRHTLHTSLEAYHGTGRFIGLVPLGTTSTIESLTVVDCPWVTAHLLEDNRVLLLGNGTLEYGPAGFAPGSGTTVVVADSLVVSGLADNTVYDYYPLCSSSTIPCHAPQQWHTSQRVDVPYCIDFTTGLPQGWHLYSDATISTAAQVADNCLTLTVDGDRQVYATLPILPDDSLTVDLEVWFSSTSVALLVGDQNLRIPAGSWQSLRLITGTSRRPRIQAIGTGTVKIRRVEISSCNLPNDLAVRQLGGGHIVLTWGASATTPFFMELIPDGETTGTTFRATSSPMELQLLPDTLYRLYVKCDSASSTCRPPLPIATLPPPTPLPYCLPTVSAQPDHWFVQPATNGASLMVLPMFDTDSLRRLNIMFHARAIGRVQTVVIGAMNDADDPTSFDSLAAFTIPAGSRSLCFLPLDNYFGNGRFLALRLQGNTQLDSLSVSDCAAYGFQLGETGAEHATFHWQQQGSPLVSIEYGPAGFSRGSGLVATATTPPLVIAGLDPLTDYSFYVDRLCDDSLCRPSLVDTFFTFTPKGGVGCIDYTDLHAPYVTCKYGSYDSPSAHTGVIDYGYLNAASRHTVHFDTTERDALTGGLLRTVPQGEKASVRLGNWTTGGSGSAQAESITYGMTVDSSQSNLLILKYAAVLQDPEHSADLQPRFRLEILNQNDELIDSCGLAFFIANPDLGWNVAANEVLWKDWTTVGLDLGAYAGQTIYVRLTTNDCGEGSHFGYAYFTLECATRRMLTEGCSDVPSNRFTAPSGFHYRWYSNQDASTLSDSASIWVRSDNSMTYYCELSFVDNPTCSFTMSAFAGARYPLALFDTSLVVEDCQYALTLINQSTISGDGITPIGTGEECESVHWILPDSSSAVTNTVIVHLADTGTYDITLVTGIANDQCLDTLRRSIHIARPHPDAVLTGRAQRCDNDAPDTLRVLNATAYSWGGGGSGDLAITPMADTAVSCYTVDHNGCRDTLTHSLRVMPTYHIFDTDSICNTAASYLWIDTTVAIDQTSGVVGRERLLATAAGCDSVRTLALQLMPSYDITHHDTLCHDSRMPFFDTILATSGSYFHADSTAFGCDSLVTMQLHIVPRAYAIDRREVCDSLTWIDGITYRSDNRSAIDTLTTPRGCDSVVTLNLTVHRSTLELAVDTFCQGTTYLFRRHVLTEGGHYADTLATRYGCDSVLALDLTRLAIPILSISSDYDCDSLYHHITATSDVPYLQWSAFPDDPTLEGQEHGLTLAVKPESSTTYTLYADYAEAPHCPATATLTLAPASKPEVVLKVNPGALRPQHREFDAYDLSADYSERHWYVDGVWQSETSRHLHATAADDAESATVALVVSDGHCVDTAIAILPVLFNDIVAPNAFTPDEETNNRFFIVSRGLSRAELSIFNRNGVVVYSSTDLEQQWDGRTNGGDPCPTGNYVWHLRYSTVLQPNAIYSATGSVLLLR